MTARPSSVFLRDATRTALRMEHPEAGQRFLNAVDSTVKALLAQPELGRFRPEVKPGLRSWAVEGFGNWIIFYRMGKESLRLVRVLHGARDLPRALRRDG